MLLLHMSQVWPVIMWRALGYNKNVFDNDDNDGDATVAPVTSVDDSVKEALSIVTPTTGDLERDNIQPNDQLTVILSIRH